MADVAMPRLSDSMEEGTILKWLKSDGDEVEQGEELVEIETDKANMTYEADEGGVLKIVAQEGDTLPVGETIAQIGEGGGDAGEDDGEAGDEGDEDEPQAGDEGDEDEPKAGSDEGDDDEPKAGDEGDEDEPKAGSKDDDEDEAEAGDEGDDDEPKAGGKGDDEDEEEAGGEADGEAEEESRPVATDEGEDGGGNGRVKASPVARRMARELGVELGSLEGSGPGGRIVKSDVEAAAGDGAPAKEEKADKPKEKAPAGDGASGRGETTVEDLTRLQQTIARRMAESKATAPEFVLTAEVDMGEAVEFRKQLKSAVGEDGVAPSFNDFVVKSAALALREFPRANGAYRDGKFELYSRINVGIAVAGQDALIVPTIFDADRKSLGEIARTARDLAGKVRDGKITPPELASGTFSVSNLGMFGIKRFVAVINPPQAGILAVGEMTPRPVVRDGEVTVRPLMEITLTCDHRILYGADAAEFLGKIRERLENPLTLAL